MPVSISEEVRAALKLLSAAVTADPRFRSCREVQGWNGVAVQVCVCFAEAQKS